MNIQKVKIGNALESSAADRVVAESSAIFDQGLNLYQDVINAALTAGLINVQEKDETVVSSITENVTSVCTITGASNSGKTEIILYQNGANTDLEVIVPITYATPDGNPVTLLCPVSGFCRVTYRNIDGTVYADTQQATSSNAVMENALVDYRKTYLTFIALESGTFTLTIPSAIDTDYVTSVSYSLDNGGSWTTTENSGNEVVITTDTIAAGNSVMWKGEASAYANSSVASTFSSTGSFAVQGNIMSLLYNDNFSGQVSMNVYSFSKLFFDSDVVNAENLVLPSTTLTEGCYSGMFQGCTGLTTAPTLLATTLAASCYKNMFNGCTALGYIKCMATDISATDCTDSWVDSVAVAGRFVKSPAMADWTTGSDGIPTGWEVNNGFPDSDNVQPDWNISNTLSEAYIVNKPIIAAQVQSDWEQSDTGAVDYIKNKPTMPKEFVVLSYGHSTWAEAYSAYTENRIVYCRASSNSNPGTGDQTRMAFLAYVNNPTDPTELEFQYYRSVATKSATNYTDQVFAYKFNKTSGWSVQTRSVTPKIVAGTNIVSGYTQGTNPTITISAPNVATLVDGKIPASQLPSYVDDVVELLNMTDTAPSTCAEGDMYYNTSSKKIFTATGTNTWSSTGENPEGGKIYVNLSDNTSYRWGGSDMVQISASLVIGTTQGTAADGKVVNDHVTDTDIHVTTSDKSTWSGKQDAINDLQDIRNGAASGATAYQVPSGGIPLTDMASAVQSTVTSAITSSTVGLKIEVVSAMPAEPAQNTLYIVQ